MLRRTFLLAFFAPTLAQAHSYKLGNIFIGHAWALPQQLADGQVFFPMAIKGNESDELVAARSDVCTFIQLRENNHYDDPPLESIKLEPGKPVPMRPTATHLRLAGMKHPLKVGGHFKIILDFKNAGEIEIEVQVTEKPGE
jgi:copper(I)-binding protein